MPLVWSGCRCDISTTSMLLGSTPAAARFCRVRPTAPLLGSRVGDAVAAIDQDQLAAGVDELRVERHRHHALRHVGGFGGGQRLLLRHVLDERVGHRERARPVIDRGAFEAADLVAIEARRLRAGWRHRGRGGRCSEMATSAAAAPAAAAPAKQLTTIQIGHGEFSPAQRLRFFRICLSRQMFSRCRENASLIVDGKRLPSASPCSG